MVPRHSLAWLTLAECHSRPCGGASSSGPWCQPCYRSFALTCGTSLLRVPCASLLSLVRLNSSLWMNARSIVFAVSNSFFSARRRARRTFRSRDLRTTFGTIWRFMSVSPLKWEAEQSNAPNKNSQA